MKFTSKCSWVSTESIHSSLNLKKKELNRLLKIAKNTEMWENGEHQKALTHLMKRLAPFSHRNFTLNQEIKEMCFLLTTNTIGETTFKHWDGSNRTAREKIITKFQQLFDNDLTEQNSMSFGMFSSCCQKWRQQKKTNQKTANTNLLPPNRLITLLSQSLLYQSQVGRFKSTSLPTIERCFATSPFFFVTFDMYLTI